MVRPQKERINEGTNKHIEPHAADATTYVGSLHP